MADSYIVVSVDNITPTEAEILGSEAFDFGASGTEEKLLFTQGGRTYEPTSIQPDITGLRIYFEMNPSPVWIEDIQSRYPEARVSVLTEPNKDWMEEWKKGYAAFELGGGIWIVPSWLETPKEALRALKIDPGMAFGTGTHETTKLAAGFILDYSGHFDKTMLDVGTGTGILGFLGELLGFESIKANDNDPEATRVARENAELNGLTRTQIVDTDLAQIEGQFDWVVANIIDGVLCDLQKDLRSRVNPGGVLLLTGILAERENHFLTEFSFEGFRLVERRQLGEWVGFLLRRN